MITDNAVVAKTKNHRKEKEDRGLGGTFSAVSRTAEKPN